MSWQKTIGASSAAYITGKRSPCRDSDPAMARHCGRRIFGYPGMVTRAQLAREPLPLRHHRSAARNGQGIPAQYAADRRDHWLALADEVVE